MLPLALRLSGKGGGGRTESWYGSAANDVTTKKRERTNKLGNEIADEMCFTWNPLFFLLTAYFTRRGAPSYEPRRGAEGYADEDRPVTNDVLPCRARESKKMNGTVFEFCPFFFPSNSLEFPRFQCAPLVLLLARYCAIFRFSVRKHSPSRF